MDKSLNIYAHRLLLSVLNYQACILTGDLQRAQSLAPQIPDSYHSKLAKFLETNGQKDLAFHMTSDLDHKFELAITLNYVEEARKIAETQGN